MRTPYVTYIDVLLDMILTARVISNVKQMNVKQFLGSEFLIEATRFQITAI